MTKTQQLDFMIHELMPQITVPKDINEKQRLFRSLVNLRPAGKVSAEFLRVQDDFLQKEIRAKGITDVNTLSPIQDKIYLWQGDITTLKVDAIVNAANSQMTGCYFPCHGCIDNAVHTFAGVQLRNECDRIMQAQGFPEPAGQAKITPAYNLPSRYILHTVGPIVHGEVTPQHCNLLASCYASCLKLADKYKLTSIAFCCISTGEFHFPPHEAAQIAVATVQKFSAKLSLQKIVFNVFTDRDKEIYRNLLTAK